MSALTAAGGFAPPVLPYHTAWELDHARLLHEVLPIFRAARGGIDFTPPEVRWARARERELRAGRKIWDFPPVPEVAR